MLPELRPEQDDGSNPGLSGLIAAAADVCRKPLRHAVVLLDAEHPDQPIGLADLLDRGDDLRLRLECRDQDGVRWADQDLELELYRSGDDLNRCWAGGISPTALVMARTTSRVDGWQHRAALFSPTGCCPARGLTRRLRALLLLPRE